MNNVERFRALMNFEPVDRVPMIEWAGYWDKTVENWYEQGLDRSLPVTDPAKIRSHFGLDRYYQWWFLPRGEGLPVPEYHGAPVLKNPDDYRKYKDALFPESSFSEEMFRSWAKEHENGDAVVWITFDGYFWFPRTLFGIEGHMYAFYDYPELMHEMNNDVTEYNLKMLDRLVEIVKPDFMTFGEDMSYNHGPMLSKENFDEFLAPYYKRIVPRLKEHGIIPFVDSDGDIAQLIPWLKEVGIEGVLPLERMAGVDVGQIRREHPEFKLIGAFDKTIMKDGEEPMRKEFERLLPVMKQGGFIASVDHQTPPDVSLENYRIYVRLLKEYCEKAAD